jgi:predicted CopG family antitoxin
MKTITLDEEAYQRLKAWKRSSGDSCSKVVKRVVPEAGTLGSLLEFANKQGTESLPGNGVMEAAIEERSGKKANPWTS